MNVSLLKETMLMNEVERENDFLNSNKTFLWARGTFVTNYEAFEKITT